MMKVEIAGGIVIGFNIALLTLEWNRNLCMAGFNLGAIVGTCAVVVLASPILKENVRKRMEPNGPPEDTQ